MPFSKDQFLDADFSTAEDNVLKKFYIPALKESIKYDGAIGYFSTHGLFRVLQGIEGLVKNKGKMRLVIGKPLKDEEYNALIENKISDQYLSTWKEDWTKLFTSEHSEVNRYRLEIFSWLFNNNYLEIKYAIRRRGMYHKKIGILHDSDGQIISFAGSINFTENALMSNQDEADGNSEQFDVYPSWEESEFKRHGLSKIIQFDNVWNNNEANTKTLEIPSEHYKEIQDYYTANEPPKSDAEKVTSALYDKIDGKKPPAGGSGTRPIIKPRFKKIENLFKHQQDAIDKWELNDHHGVLEHATGSGKTVTALKAAHDHLKTGGVVLILVPSKLLFKQWQEEIKDEIDDPVIMLAGNQNNKWKKGLLRRFVRADSNSSFRIVLSIMQTATSDEFIDSFSESKNLLLIADEVHQIGSKEKSKVMQINAKKRLGLSATPKRHGDPDGTEKIINYFNKIMQPPFSLNDAISAGRLVPYRYFPGLLHLTREESDQWRIETEKIRKEIAVTNNDKKSFFLSKRASMLLINRSRIAKKSKCKLKYTKKVIQENFEKGQKWLIYCEDQDQLNEVKKIIENLKLDVFEYHSNMSGSSEKTLDLYEHNGGILVSIKCLDEGVDIPSISHALILASSQNPRQFIQRRGRVLRVHGSQKTHADLYDALIVPIDIDIEPEQIALLKSEIVRAYEFASNALNKSAAIELKIKSIEMGLILSDIIGEGYEVEDD